MARPVVVANGASAMAGTANGAAAHQSDRAARGLMAGLFALSLLALGIGYLDAVPALRVAGLLGGACFGVGAAPLQLARRPQLTARIGFACVLGFSTLTLAGSALVLLRFWHPVPVAVALGGAAAVLHVAGLLRMRGEHRRSAPVHVASRNDRTGLVELREELVAGPVARSREAPRPLLRLAPDALGAQTLIPAGLVLAGTALWLTAAVSSGHIVPGNGGFLAKIGPLWYGGLLLLAAAIALARGAREPVAMSAVVSLVIGLTLTPALLYGMPEVQTAGKHIELVQTILRQHHLNTSAGIYDTYSGFFSAIAWLCDLGRIRDSLGIATYWPCIIGLVGVAELRWLFGTLIKSRFRIWAAVTLAVLANTVEENYFSPQSLGIVLAIGVFALVLDRSPGAVDSRLRNVLLVVAGCALAITHELSPFITGSVLVVLALLRCGRPRWAAAAMLAPATAWAFLNQSVLAPYFSLSNLFQTANFAPPALATAPTLRRQLITIVSFDALVAGLLVLIALATVGWIRHRREGWAWACVLGPAVGLIFTAVNPYNNEGVYRAILFGIPWLAVLAAHAPNARPRRWVVGAFALLTLIMLATFSAATFALDGFTVIRPADLTALRRFEAQAPPGSFNVTLGFNELPGTVATSRTPYRYVSWQVALTARELDRAPAPSDVALLAHRLTRDAAGGPAGRPVSVYATWSPAAPIYAADYGLMSAANELAWLRLMRQSPLWQVEYAADGTYLFKLRPAQTLATPGP